jgi:hypothetical protein
MDTNSSDLFGGCFDTVLSPAIASDRFQEFDQFGFVASKPFQDLQVGGFSENMGWQSPTAVEQPGGSQLQEWQSSVASQHAESLHGDTEAEVSLMGSVIGDHTGEPSREEVMAENARLKAMMETMKTRLSKTQTRAASKTPPVKAQSNHPQATPLKRTASRVADFDPSPSKRPRSKTPVLSSTPPGPIEAMWSSGVTPEQRRAMHKQLASSPAANTNASITTPTRKSVAKKARTQAPRKLSKQAKAQPQQAQYQHQRTSSISSLPTSTVAGAPVLSTLQASSSNERPISVLYKENFMSLTMEEKARLLFPLLQGIDPETGEKWTEAGTLALKVHAAAEEGDEPTTCDDQAHTSMQMPAVQTTSLSNAPFGSLVSGMQTPPTTSPAKQTASSDTYDFEAFPTLHTSLAKKSAPETVTTGDAYFESFMSSMQTPRGANESFEDFMASLAEPSTPAPTEQTSPAYEHDSDFAPASATQANPASDNEDAHLSETDISALLSYVQGSSTDAANGASPFTTQPLDLLSNFNTATSDQVCDFDFSNNSYPSDLTATEEFLNLDDFTTLGTTDLESMVQSATAMIASPESGATRQREALMQHERRAAEGRRR